MASSSPDTQTYKELNAQRDWSLLFFRHASMNNKKEVNKMLPELDTRLKSALKRDFNKSIITQSVYSTTQKEFVEQLFDNTLRTLFMTAQLDRKHIFHLLKRQVKTICEWPQNKFNFQAVYEDYLSNQGAQLGQTSAYYVEVFYPEFKDNALILKVFWNKLSEGIGQSLNIGVLDLFERLYSQSAEHPIRLNPYALFHKAYAVSPRSSHISLVNHQEKFFERLLASPLFSNYSFKDNIHASAFESPPNAEALNILFKSNIYPTIQNITTFFTNFPYIKDKDLLHYKQISSVYIHYLFEQGHRQTIKEVEKKLEEKSSRIFSDTHDDTKQELLSLIKIIRERNEIQHKLKTVLISTPDTQTSNTSKLNKI